MEHLHFETRRAQLIPIRTRGTLGKPPGSAGHEGRGPPGGPGRGWGRGPRARLPRGRIKTVRSAGMGKRLVGRGGRRALQGGDQGRGVRADTPRSSRPPLGPRWGRARREAWRRTHRAARAAASRGVGGGSVQAARALALALAGSARPPRRRGRACPGPGGGPGAAGPPSAYRSGRAAGGSGPGALAARSGPGAPAAAAGEGALALPRWPLLSVCVCSKMAARLAPRDTDAGPRGRPLRSRRRLLRRLPFAALARFTHPASCPLQMPGGQRLPPPTSPPPGT